MPGRHAFLFLVVSCFIKLTATVSRLNLQFTEGGPLEEKRLVKETDWERVKVKKDETYCIISAKWLSAWKDYVNYDDDQTEESARPGPIVNDNLIRPETKESIRKEFSEGKHYEILPEKVWNYLVTWYVQRHPLFVWLTLYAFVKVWWRSAFSAQDYSFIELDE